MTRTVSKILATIAMVVVLPLMVVGTAFVAFFSTDKTINVSAVVDELAATTVEAPKFDFDGTLYTSKKITTGQKRTVEVTAQASVVGYTFQGWFAGSEAEYREAAAGTDPVKWLAGPDQTKLSIKMEEAVKEYVAVYNVVRYNVTNWSYAQNPETPDVLTNKAPKNAKESYKYGEALPTANDFETKYEGKNYSFAGWMVQGAQGESAKAETKAVFKGVSTDNMTLVGVWDKVQHASIKFYGEDNVELTDESLNEYKTVIVGKLQTLPDARTYAKNAQDGWRYYWADKDGHEKTTITPTAEQNYDLYLRKSLITYKVQISNLDGASYIGNTSGNPNAVTFTVETQNNTDFAKLFVAENWKLNRVYFEFGGLSWGEYKDAASVAENFVKENKDHAETVTLTLNIVKNYSKFTVSTPVTYLAGVSGAAEASEPVYQSSQGGTNESRVGSVGLENKSTEEYTMAELLGLDKIEKGDWYGKSNGEKRYLELKELAIVIGETSVFHKSIDEFDFEVIKDLTFAEFINVALSQGENFEQSGLKAEIANSDPVEIMNIASISVKFNITNRVIAK